MPLRLFVQIYECRDLRIRQPHFVVEVDKAQKKSRSIKGCKSFQVQEFDIRKGISDLYVHVFEKHVQLQGTVIVSLTPISEFMGDELVYKCYPVIPTYSVTGLEETGGGLGQLVLRLSMREVPSEEAGRVWLSRFSVDEGDTVLIALVKSRASAHVTNYLRHATVEEVNEVDSFGYTALLHACSDKAGLDHIVMSLLSFKHINTVAAVRSDHNTALHYFCQTFSSPDLVIDAFNHFIARGANVNAKNDNGETPLFKAIFNTRIRLMLVTLLLENGADVNVYNDSHGEGLLHYAVRLNRPDLVNVLLQAGADLQARSKRTCQTPLQVAAADGNTAIQLQLQEAEELLTFLYRHDLTQYRPTLFKHGVTLGALAEMNSVTELEALGITSAVARERILRILHPNVPQGSLSTPSGPLSLRSIPREMNSNECGEADIFALLKSVKDQNYNLDSSQIEFLRKLGGGSSGEVFHGLYLGRPVAVKMLRESTKVKELDEFHKELAILCTVRSPHVVSFFGACMHPKMCIVMEYCSRGSLYHVLKDANLLIGWDEFFHMAVEACMGVHALHSHNPTPILHRDIKTLNFLVTKDWRVKVCDFGLARPKETNNETFLKLCGTMSYSAPEVFHGKMFSAKSDVYSMGIVLWELLYRVIMCKYQQPFSEFPDIKMDFQIIIQVAKFGKRPTIPVSTPPPLRKLITRCLSAEPDDRPTAEELVKGLKIISREYKASQSLWNQSIKGAKDISNKTGESGKAPPP